MKWNLGVRVLVAERRVLAAHLLQLRVGLVLVLQELLVVRLELAQAHLERVHLLGVRLLCLLALLVQLELSGVGRLLRSLALKRQLVHVLGRQLLALRLQLDAHLVALGALVRQRLLGALQALRQRVLGVVEGARQLDVVVARLLETRGEVLLDVGVVAGHEGEREVAQVLERVDLDDVEVGVAVVVGQRLLRVELQLKLGRLGALVLLTRAQQVDEALTERAEVNEQTLLALQRLVVLLAHVERVEEERIELVRQLDDQLLDEM